MTEKFLQVAQIFAKQSKRNEGHTMQQYRPYWHTKVARYSFSGSIPPNYVCINPNIWKNCHHSCIKLRKFVMIGLEVTLEMS